MKKHDPLKNSKAWLFDFVVLLNFLNWKELGFLLLMLLFNSRSTSQEAVLHNPLHIKSMVRFILLKLQNVADVFCVHV